MKKLNNTHKLILILTVVLAITVFLVIFANSTPLQITQTLPLDNQKYASDNTTISLLFNTQLSLKQQQKLSFEIIPEFNYKTSYQNNYLTLTPTHPLQKNTLYKIKIFYKNSLIYFFSFQTNPYSTTELQEQAAKQTQDDIEFGKTYQSFLEKNPWYPSIPIKTKAYTIWYNFEKNAFRITPTTKPKTKKGEEELINQALQDIKDIGFDKEPIPHYLNYY